MRIGELARVAGCTAETVRFYEASGVLSRPHRTPSGYRKYEQRHVEELVFARHCRALGLSLREITGLISLQHKPEKACDGANRLIDQRIREVESQIASLGSLKRLLTNLRDGCGDSRPSKDCGILRGLADPVSNAPIRSAVASG